jgi:FdhD protein
MVQKAWAAGFPLLVSVSAASALAVEVARRAGIVVVGFARDRGLVVYD